MHIFLIMITDAQCFLTVPHTARSSMHITRNTLPDHHILVIVDRFFFPLFLGKKYSNFTVNS